MVQELEARVTELNVNERTLTRLVRALTAEQLDQHDPVSGYSPRQALAHLVGGTRSMTVMGKNWIKGENTKLRADFDLNLFNQRQQEKRAQLSLDALLEEWHAAHRDVIAFLETITADDLEKRGDHPAQEAMTLRELMRVISYHEAMHIVFVLAATQE